VTRLCDELLQGAIDLHQHAAPSVFERVTDDIGLALESRQRGMRAVLLKAHEHDTTGRAALVRRQVPGIETFGGIVLNHSVGGLNPQAVDGCIKLGGRMVWMPTLSARHHIGSSVAVTSARRCAPRSMLPIARRRSRRRSPACRSSTPTARSCPGVREILELIAAADICFSTGHLSLPEIRVLVKEARSIGVRKRPSRPTGRFSRRTSSP